MKPVIMFLIALLFSGGLSQAAEPVSRAQPNIVIFLTDDESWQERSVYGWSNLPTPYFDRVAREGVLCLPTDSHRPLRAPRRGQHC
jgi:hypothetical protein